MGRCWRSRISAFDRVSERLADWFRGRVANVGHRDACAGLVGNAVVASQQAGEEALTAN